MFMWKVCAYRFFGLETRPHWYCSWQSRHAITYLTVQTGYWGTSMNISSEVSLPLASTTPGMVIAMVLFAV